jgi:hypothetical protein
MNCNVRITKQRQPAMPTGALASERLSQLIEAGGMQALVDDLPEPDDQIETLA